MPRILVAPSVIKHQPGPYREVLEQAGCEVVSPHMGGLDVESQRDMSTLAAQRLVELHQDRWPEGCVVNAELRSGWRW